MIPRLETERLVLRAPEPRDFDAFAAFYATERSAFVGGPLDRAKAWRAFAVEIGHWTLRGWGMWSVAPRGDEARCLGLVGAWDPEGWPEPEISWSVFAEAEGRGIAHEATVAARACLYDRFGWRTAVSYVAPENARSRRLAERLGATVDPDAPLPALFEKPMLVFRHPAPEALA